MVVLLSDSAGGLRWLNTVTNISTVQTSIINHIKQIEEPAISKQAKRVAARGFAVARQEELWDSAQEPFKLQELLSTSKEFDANAELASSVFVGAINYASKVFGNCLVFGRGDYRKEDKAKILAALREILDILEK